MINQEIKLRDRLDDLLLPVKSTFENDLATFIIEEIKNAEHQGQKNLLERIIQDMFAASALNLPMDYIYNLKKEINPSKKEDTNVIS